VNLIEENKEHDPKHERAAMEIAAAAYVGKLCESAVLKVFIKVFLS
jgi:hypothetical protein